jgi:hypothetical protein
MQTAIADPLALRILEGDFRDGDSLRVVVAGDRLDSVGTA